MENSIYNNTMYFGSNIYDDEVVNKLLYELIGSSLDRNVKDQAIVDDLEIYNGKGSLFTVSSKNNSLYGLRADALTHTIQNVDIIPESYKKRFISKYGYNKPIQFETILTDGQLFNRVPHLYLFEAYLYYGLSVVIRMDRSIILVVDQSGPFKLSASQITTLLAGQTTWQLVMERATTSYHYYGSFSSIAVSGKDAIRISSFTQLAEIMDLSKDSTNYNSWNISFGTAAPNDPMLLSKIPASITTISGSSDYAISYASGINAILKAVSGSMHILLEHRPNREKVFHEIEVPVSQNGKIIMQLYGENGDPYQPYSSKSLRFYAISTGGGNKLPNSYGYLINLNDQLNITLKDTAGIYEIDVNNVPNLSNMLTGGNLAVLVDAQVHPKSATGTKYDCPVKHSIEIQLKGADNPFGQELPSTHYQRHSRVIGDRPYTSFQYDFEDFKSSEFKDDIRAYKLSKLKMLLNSNPDNYKKLANVLYKKTCPVRTAYLSTTEDKLPHVKDTSFIATSVRDDTLVFDEEQSYVILHSDMKYWAKPYVSLYINGIYTHPTYIGYHDFDIYVFFPRVLNQKYDYDNTKFLPVSSRDIVVDIYFKSSVDPKDQARSELTFNSTGSPQLLFPNGIKRSTIATKNLIAYNSATKEIIDMSNFNFYTEITTSRVKIDDNEMTITHPASIDVIYLITNDGEFFKTKDGNLIILSEETTQVPLNSEYAILGNKEIDTDNLYISTNNEKYVGTAITFISNDKPEIRKFEYNALKTGVESIDGADYKYIELELPDWYNGDLSNPGSFRLHCKHGDNGYTIPLINFVDHDNYGALGYLAEPRSKITDPLKIKLFADIISEVYNQTNLLDELLAVGDKCYSYTSVNGGHSWIPGAISGSLTHTIYDVCYHDGTLICIGTISGSAGSGVIYRSTDDGLTWTMRKLYNSLRSICHSNGIWFIMTRSSYIFQSVDDGLTWTDTTWTPSYSGYDIEGNSKTGVTMALLSSGSSAYPAAVLRSDNNFTTSKRISISLGTNSQANAFCNNGNSTWIAVGLNSAITRSTDDGLTWNKITINDISENLKSIAYSSDTGTWIIVGFIGTILRSTDDGLSWTKITSGVSDNLSKVIYYENNIWIATSYDSKIMQSVDDGLTWYTRISDARNIGINSVVKIPKEKLHPEFYLEHLPYDWSNAITSLDFYTDNDDDSGRLELNEFFKGKPIDEDDVNFRYGGFIADRQLFDRYQPNQTFNKYSGNTYFLNPPEALTEFQIITTKYSPVYYYGTRISPNAMRESCRLNTIEFLLSCDTTHFPIGILYFMYGGGRSQLGQVYLPQLDLLKSGFYREQFPPFKSGDRLGNHNFFMAISQKIVSSEADTPEGETRIRIPESLFSTIWNDAGKEYRWSFDYIPR